MKYRFLFKIIKKLPFDMICGPFEFSTYSLEHPQWVPSWREPIFRLIGIQFQEKRKLKVELHKLLSESLVYGSNPDENWKNNNIARLY